MRHRKRALFWALVTVAVGAIIPSAWAWTVTMDAKPALVRTHSWKIEKSVSQPSLALKKGESATVTYSVTVGPNGAPVDSGWSVSGNMEMSEDPDITIGSVVFDVLPDTIVASHECMPMTFPVNLGIEGLKCTYSAALPDASSPRTAHMKAVVSSPAGFRQVNVPFDFADATVNEVDECVDVTDSMAGALGTVCAADAPRTFTYTATIGPFAECGSKTVDNTASYTANDSGATGSAGASVAVTVSGCKPKCPLPSRVWKYSTIVGPGYVKNLLPITIGTPGGSKSVAVPSTLQALVILGADWYSSNPVSLLSTEVLAAKLNAAAGRDVSSIADALDEADAFLATRNAYSTLTWAEKEKAKGLKAQLDKYNNKCIPDFGYDHDGDNDCRDHWEKPDHDWNKWDWNKFDWDDGDH